MAADDKGTAGDQAPREPGQNPPLRVLGEIGEGEVAAEDEGDGPGRHAPAYVLASQGDAGAERVAEAVVLASADEAEVPPSRRQLLERAGAVAGAPRTREQGRLCVGGQEP